MKLKSINIRYLLTMITLLSVAPLAVLVSIKIYRDYNQNVDNQKKVLLKIAEFANDKINENIYSYKTMLQSLAYTEEIYKKNNKELSDLLSYLKSFNPSLNNISIIDSNGSTISSSNFLEEHVNNKNSTWFQKIQKSKNFTISDYQLDKSSGKYVVNMSYPLLHQDLSKSISVINITVYTQSFYDILINTQIPFDAILNLVNKEGIIIARNVDNDKFAGQLSKSYPIFTSLKEKSINDFVVTTSSDGIERIWTFNKVSNSYGELSVGMGYNNSLLLEEVLDELKLDISLLLLSIIFVITFAWITSNRKIIYPIQNLSRIAKEYKREGFVWDNKFRSGTSEIIELYDSFMFVANELNRYNTQLEELINIRTEEYEKKNDDLIIEITKRKDIEYSLTLALNSLNNLFNNSAVGNIKTTFNGEIISANNYILEAVGCTSLDDLINFVHNDVRNLYVDPNERVYIMKTLIKDNKVENYEARFVSKTGSVVWLNLFMSIVSNESDDEAISIETLAINVTERKNYEKNLEENFNLLQNILDNIPQRVYWKDTTTSYLGCNRAHSFDMGLFSPDEIIGKKDADLIWKNIAEAEYLEDISVIENKSKIQDKEQEVILSNRSEWIRKNKIPLINKYGDVFGILCVYETITEEKNATEKLNNRIAELDHFFDLNLDLLSIFSFEGYFIRLNKSWEVTLGYSLDSIKQKSIYDFIHPDDIAYTKKELNRLNKGETIYQFVNRWKHKSGSYRWLELAAATADNSIFAAARDITDQKDYQNAIQESEKRFRAFFNNANIGIAISDRNNNLMIYNDKVLEIFNYTANEMKGQSWFKLTHPDYFTEINTYLTKLINLEISTFRVEERFISKDGTVFWGELGVSSISDYNGEVKMIIYLLNDITEKVTFNDRLQKLNDELKESNVTKDKFLSIIAHDLKNPLGNFRDVTKLLTESYNDLTEDDKLEFLHLMKDSSKNVYNLLENLLEWSRSQRGTIPFNPIATNLKLATTEIVQLLKPNADNKNIDIEINISTTFNPKTDANMIRTIIRNLISNAIKFTPNGGTINIGANVEDNMIIVFVQDSGVGMEESVMSTLFKIGTTKSSLGTDGESGTGVGLILCKEFVEKHGGKIWVTSKINKGTTFYFTLPLEGKGKK